MIYECRQSASFPPSDPPDFLNPDSQILWYQYTTVAPWHRSPVLSGQSAIRPNNILPLNIITLLNIVIIIIIIIIIQYYDILVYVHE